jgi:hypothetical protein
MIAPYGGARKGLGCGNGEAQAARQRASSQAAAAF